MADTTLNEVHAQTVREIADELHGQLDAFADAVAAGDVDEQMTVDVFQRWQSCILQSKTPQRRQTRSTTNQIGSGRWTKLDEQSIISRRNGIRLQ